MAERLFPILYLELNAVGLTILLIVLFSQQRTGHGSADQRFFSALALSDVAMLALDSAMWLLDGQRFPLARPLLTLASAAYYLLTPLASKNRTPSAAAQPAPPSLAALSPRQSRISRQPIWRASRIIWPTP